MLRAVSFSLSLSLFEAYVVVAGVTTTTSEYETTFALPKNDVCEKNALLVLKERREKQRWNTRKSCLPYKRPNEAKERTCTRFPLSRRRRTSHNSRVPTSTRKQGKRTFWSLSWEGRRRRKRRLNTNTRKSRASARSRLLSIQRSAWQLREHPTVQSRSGR